MKISRHVLPTSQKEKQSAQIIEKDILYISEKDFYLLYKMLENPPAPNKALLKAAKSAKRKIKFTDKSLI